MDYTPDGYGLKFIIENFMDGYQPMSIGLLTDFAHNQELISDTFKRHLVNDWHHTEITYNHLGKIAASYGPFIRIPNTDCTVRVNVDSPSGCNLITVASTNMIIGEWYYIDPDDNKTLTYPEFETSGNQVVSLTLSDGWNTSVVIPPDIGYQYYISQVFLDTSGTSDQTLRLYSTSIIQRRRITK